MDIYHYNSYFSNLNGGPDSKYTVQLSPNHCDWKAWFGEKNTSVWVMKYL